MKSLLEILTYGLLPLPKIRMFGQLLHLPLQLSEEGKTPFPEFVPYEGLEKLNLLVQIGAVATGQPAVMLKGQLVMVERLKKEM